MDLKMKKENRLLLNTLLWTVLSIGVHFALKPFKIDLLSAIVIYIAFVNSMYCGMSTFYELKKNHKSLDSDTNTLIKSILLFSASACSTIMLFQACDIVTISNYGLGDFVFVNAIQLFIIVFATHFSLTFMLVEFRNQREIRSKVSKYSTKSLENNHLVKTLLWLAISIGVSYALEPFGIDWLTAVGMYVAVAFTMYYCTSTYSELKETHEHLDSDMQTLTKSLLVSVSFATSVAMLLSSCVTVAISQYGSNVDALLKASELFIFLYMVHVFFSHLLVEVRLIKELRTNEAKSKLLPNEPKLIEE